MQTLAENPTGVIKEYEDIVYAVAREGEENLQTVFFGRAHHAILWAMLTNPYLLPAKDGSIPLDEDHVVGEIQTFPSNPEHPIPNLIYSGDVSHYLYQYYATKNIPFYTNKILSDTELETSLFPDLATHKRVETTTPIFNTPFVFENQDKSVDFNRSMTAMLKVFDLIKEGREIPQLRVSFDTFKLRNPRTMKAVTRYGLDWEKIWFRFAECRLEMKQLNLPDTFKFFYAAKEYLVQNSIHFQKYFALLNEGELRTNEAVGNTFCLKKIYGFSWENNSCFMDSTLIAMFAFNGSPFMTNLIERDLPEVFRDTLCCNNRRTDKIIRTRINQALRLEVEQLTEGKIIVCSELRKALGKLCRRTPDDEDYSTEGPNRMGYDPNDLYDRLMKAMEYNPITMRQSSTVALNEQGSQAREVSSYISKAPALLPKNVYDVDRISYPASWNTGYGATGSRETPYMAEELKILQADVIVFQLGRGFNAEAEREAELLSGIGKGKEETSDLDKILSSISAEAQPTQEEASDNLSSLLDALNSMPAGQPTQPAKGYPGGYTQKRVEIDRVFNVNGIPYNLRAVVFLPYAGHYAALINCGTSWFEYDDTKLNHKPNLITQNYLSDAKADEIISTKAVMFFYYPDPANEEARRQIERRVMADDEQRYGKYVEQRLDLPEEELEEILRPITEEELYQARCVWDVAPRQPEPVGLFPTFPSTNEDEELQRAIAMSQMQEQPLDEDEELRRAIELSRLENASSPFSSSSDEEFEEELSEQNVMPTIRRPWKQDFLQRWFNSKILVIGASYTEQDFLRWVYVDMNYIGVKMVNPKLRDQVVEFAGDNSVNLFGGVWNEDPVWETLLDLVKMTDKKFDAVWLDLDAWKQLSSYSGMGKKLVESVGQVLVDFGKNEKGEYIGTLNVPDDQIEPLIQKNNTVEEIPLWVYLVRSGNFQQVPDETFSELTDRSGTSRLYRLLLPKPKILILK